MRAPHFAKPEQCRPMVASYRTLNEGATVRNVFTGHSAFMGMTAVNLVEAGFTGEPDAVRTTYGELISDGFDSALTVANLGTDWMTASGYFKLHPTARSVHPAIDAIEDAVSSVPRGRISPDNVSSISVRTFRLAAARAQKQVQTAFGAKFSIPFALATFIFHGRATLECFDEHAVKNPAIQRLIQLVDVVEDAQMTAAYPGKQLCEVVITLQDGSICKGVCKIVRGEPGKPTTITQLQEKFMHLAVPVWGEPLASRLFKDCVCIDRIPDVSKWSEGYCL